MAGTNLEAARALLARGFSVIPIQFKGKKPLLAWEEFIRRRATDSELVQWFKTWPNANLAIVTGKISNVVVADVDVDRGGDPKPLYDVYPTETIVRTGKGGFHFYYKYPEGDDIHVYNRVGKNGIDIRGDGGYVVAPPSIHASGATYEFIRDMSIADFPSFIVEGDGEAEEKKPHQEEWLSTLLRGVESGGRNDACARLAGYFASKGLPQDVCFNLLMQWNDLNSPPLPRSEVATTVASIFKSEVHKRKSIAGQSLAQIGTMDFGSYMTKYGGERIQWIIEGWLPAKTIAFVVSPPGGFKTWMMLDLAESIASKRPFLGQFPVIESGPAIVIQQEDFHGQIVSRLSTIIAGKTSVSFSGGPTSDEFEMPLPYNIPVHFHPGRALKFDSEIAMASLEERVATLKPKVVIIDPLYSAGRVDDYMAKTAEQMLPLKKMRDQHGTSFLIVHHTKKNTEGTQLREGAWGSQFLNAFIETGWQIRTSDEEAEVTVSRHFKVSSNPPPIQVKFDISTDAPYKYIVTCSESVSADRRNDELLTIIEKSGPIGAAEIAEKMKKHRSTITRKLKKLCDDGIISRDKQDRYTIPNTPGF